MEILKKGEFIRTKDGQIDIIESYSWTTNIYHCKNGLCIDECNKIGIYIKDIKHSKNILELIENKDILKVKTEENEIIMIGFDENTMGINYKEFIESIENKEYDLLEILTYEQYESRCYKIKEEINE